MYLETLRSPVTSGKIVLLILGAVINGFGLYSHFDSAWVKKMWIAVSPAYIRVEMYKRYFVSVIIICFVLSFVGFILGLRIRSSALVFADMGYHILAGLLLLPAGVMYIVSDVQIEALIDPDGTGDFDPEINLHLAQKRIAGGLTIIQGILYFCVARVMYKYGIGPSSKDGNHENQFSTI